MVLNRCDPPSAMARAENLRAAISRRPIQARRQTLEITVSVGLALSLDYFNCDIDEIIQKADAALYAAKEVGRNCVRLARPESEKRDAAVAQTVENV